MKRFASLFGTMLLASLVLGAPFRASAAEESPHIILSEVNWAGSALSTADEWIELANLGAEPVDISGWSLTGAAGSSGSSVTVPEGTVLAGYGTYLISNYDLASGKTTLGVSPNLVTTAVSLSNSNLNVALLNLSGEMMDAATTESSSTVGSTQPFASMQRDLSTLAWVSAGVSTNLTDATQFGNPGLIGYAAPPVTEDTIPDDATSSSTEITEIVGNEIAAEEVSISIDTSEESLPPGEEASGTLETIETMSGDAQEPTDTTNVTEPSEEPAAEVNASPVGNILIKAFLSAPENGTAESITFYNTTTETIDLTGWIVADATGKATELSGIIEPLMEITLENPKGKLNNDGDTIILMDASGVVIDQVTYGTDELPEPGSGETLSRTGDAWTIIEAIMESASVDATQEPVSDNPVEVTQRSTEETTDIESPVATEEVLSEEIVSSSVETDIPAATVSEPTTVETTVPPETPETQEDFSLNLPEQGSSLNPYSAGDVLITEFVSDPADDVEWIEFYNATDTAIDLTGWTVTDATGKATELNGSLEPSMYGTVENPKGKLNNDGDSIFLYDPSGTLIDEVTYGTESVPKSKKGESVARAGDVWAVSETPTPGAINFISDETTYAEPSSSASTTDATTNPSSSGTDAVGATDHSDESQVVSNPYEVHTGSIASLSSASSIPATSSTATSVSKKTTSAAKTTTSSTKKTTTSAASSVATVSYTGVVTALPGTFGTQIAFIEGIELYFNSADWPSLQLGDVIQVRGVPSTAQGEARIKIANASAITVLRHQEEQPKMSDLSTLSQAKEGSLVRVQGTIATRDGKTLTLENENGSIQVIAHEKTGIRWSSYTGGTLQIVGVVRFLNGTVYLYPRSTADITAVADALTESAAATSAAVGDDASGSSGSFLPFAVALLATGALSGLILWMLRRRQSSALALELAANPS